MREGVEDNDFTLGREDIQNLWIFPLIPLYIDTSYCIMKHRDILKFTCTLIKVACCCL